MSTSHHGAEQQFERILNLGVLKLTILIRVVISFVADSNDISHIIQIGDETRMYRKCDVIAEKQKIVVPAIDYVLLRAHNEMCT